MSGEISAFLGHLEGEQPPVEFLGDQPVASETYAGRVHIEWDPDALVTPLGQLPFFILNPAVGFCALRLDCVSFNPWL
jgi:hypothetical protein